MKAANVVFLYTRNNGEEPKGLPNARNITLEYANFMLLCICIVSPVMTFWDFFFINIFDLHCPY